MQMVSPGVEAADPYEIPLDQLDPADPALFHNNTHWRMFERLRKEDPVHFVADSAFGPYWSITRYQDIIEVDSNHRVFSSHQSVTLDERQLKGPGEGATQSGGFIAMDPPLHDEQRKIVSPAVAPANLARLEGLIRSRTQGVLNALPIGEEFDFAKTVSIELTLMMLATLMGFPIEEKHKLKHWSDVVTSMPGEGVNDSWEQRDAELKTMAGAFLELREQRRNASGEHDLISMLATSPMARGMSEVDFVSNVTLLIVGGNDTTRNSMSGSIIAFNQFPDQWAKLMANPALVESAVSEIIRWHSPVVYQSRRAVQDYELGGKLIRAGDKLAMWYVSGNRDDSVIENAADFIIDRPRPRQHLAFGFGIHRCLGNRLAEMQLRILWEEIIRKGWSRIEVTGKPTFAFSYNLRGIDSLPVRIHA